jgi:hypothetical protein
MYVVIAGVTISKVVSFRRKNTFPRRWPPVAVPALQVVRNGFYGGRLQGGGRKDAEDGALF